MHISFFVRLDPSLFLSDSSNPEPNLILCFFTGINTSSLVKMRSVNSVIYTL